MRFSRFIHENRRFDAFMLVFFISAFAVATGSHVMDIISGGVFPYTKKWGALESLNWFWTSLTILDPLVIVTLLMNVRAGYIFAIVIMLFDVPINLYANQHYWSLAIYENYPLMMQIAFLLFLLSTVRRVWKLNASNKYSKDSRSTTALRRLSGPSRTASTERK